MDEELREIRSWVNNKERPIFKDIADRGYSIKALWNQFQRLEVHQDVLVRRFDNFSDGTTIYQALVPSKSRRDVLQFCHDTKTAGHLGI